MIYHLPKDINKPKLEFLEKKPKGKMFYDEEYLNKELRGVKYSELDDPNVIFDSVSIHKSSQKYALLVFFVEGSKNILA